MARGLPGNGGKKVSWQVHHDWYILCSGGEEIKTELFESVFTQVQLNQRESGEAAVAEILKSVIAQVQRLKVAKFGERFGTDMWNETAAQVQTNQGGVTRSGEHRVADGDDGV